MKRSLKFVVLALAVLLAVQPALATMTCTQWLCGAGHHSTDCCPTSIDGSMRNMSGNPAMDSRDTSWQTSQPALAESGCAAELCCIVTARTTVQVALSAKSNVITVAPFALPGGLSSVAAPVRVARTSRDAVAPVAARYVLFQVLRI
jgi:hypothetical protein